MVSLVGAGPGDAGLITVKGLRALKAANVVLYDRLVGCELLEEANPSAVLIDVGKKPGDPKQPSQDHINGLLVHFGKTASRVVRLKGGDPFVFGRGGEEALALKEAGIDFEIIPGVSSAIAGPASAHIPVTHRGVSNAFAVFTAHEAKGLDDGIPWTAAARIPTAIFLMGIERLSYIVSKLLEHGRPPETPVAIVSNASLPNQTLIVGTLDTILKQAAQAAPPSVIVVGNVVTIGAELNLPG
ncbi:uroporphyrinogen-III C-methyltransferase [Fimbriimonas ginsengisoli]|uniref:uroporphyrinogen-III C-methyltransferase n=1 Tax=Fimbriimonas ginsengisoli Gsoil 348 TaxID=661478 RepID=A0A068NRX8_FIMGI|nr:uroporphyrinogen-III C-methyltransferase [Fimbriimonas ginsengisoli]AIE84374.1 uroporphyrin-III C-methyltransferase [Fimbriimonas ginsengisoli Gsoil 348]